MKTGTVKFFNEEKGFGFITGADGSEIFVHKSGTRESLKQHDKVEYEEQEGKKGLNAVNVKRVELLWVSREFQKQMAQRPSMQKVALV